MSWPQTPMVVTSLPYVVATETGGCDVTGVLLSKQGYRVGRLHFPVCLHIPDQVGVAITHCLYWEVRLERTDSSVHICHQPVSVNTGASPSKCLKTSFEIDIFIYYRTTPPPSYFIVYSIISWKIYINKNSFTVIVMHQSPSHHNISRDRNVFRFLILTSRSVRRHKDMWALLLWRKSARGWRCLLTYI
jgi:hypothetical protein